MARIRSAVFAAGVAVLMGACAENTTGPSQTQNSVLSGAFASVILGYNNLVGSFDGGPDGGQVAWDPRGMAGGMMGGHHGDHDGDGPMFGGGDLMGGGLGGPFLGLGFGPGFGHGRHGDDHIDGNCTFQASSGRVVCDPVTFNGLTINKSVQYTAANGTVQQAFDSVTTDKINTRISVSGTTTRRDSSTATVQSSSDRTVAGLAKGSTQRTVNGTSAGRETVNGKNTTGTFTSVRVMGDTTKNVVIPVPTTAGTMTYPTAGTVIRAFQVTVTYTGQSPTTTTRREVVTYDGSATAKVVITENGTTKNCTLPLPHGRLTCQ